MARYVGVNYVNMCNPMSCIFQMETPIHIVHGHIHSFSWRKKALVLTLHFIHLTTITFTFFLIHSWCFPVPISACSKT